MEIGIRLLFIGLNPHSKGEDLFLCLLILLSLLNNTDILIRNIINKRINLTNFIIVLVIF
jgi:hypothetical protein